MVNRTRQNVDIMVIGSLDLDGETIDRAITYLQELKAEHGDNCFIKDYQDIFSTSDRCYTGLCRSVPETNVQMEVRIAKEEKWEKWRVEEERRQYDELKKKFGE